MSIESSIYRISVNFYINNRSNAKNNNESLILIGVSYDNERIRVSSKLKVPEKLWDTNKQKVKSGNSVNASAINYKLQKIQTDIINHYNNYINQNNRKPVHSIFKAIIKSEIIREVEIKKLKGVNELDCFIEFFQKVIETSNLSIGVRNKYKSIYTQLLRFVKTITIEEVATMDFYKDIIDFYKKEGHAKNTIGGKIKVIRQLLNIAKDEGAKKIHIPSGFKTFSENTTETYVSMEELDKLQKLQLGGKLSNVRDLFVLGCLTGLRYGDLKKLTPANISKDNILLIPEKTKSPVAIPILPETRELLNKYRINGVQNLPRSISNQRLNKYIKEVVKEMDEFKTVITKEITRGGETSIQLERWKMVASHTCRRSFATNMYKIGIQVYLIMAVTGHKTETEFFKYIRESPKEKADQFQKVYLDLTNQNNAE